MTKKKGSILNMNPLELVRKIQGIQTIESIKSILKIDKSKAVYIIYKLRKKDYVITKQDSSNMRIYYIAPENALGGTSHLDILNKYSPIKLTSSQVFKVYGEPPSIEETIIHALKTNSSRYLLSSLALFKKIDNWRELYRLAKKNNLVREVGALYDLVEIIIPRVKKMPKLYKHYALPKKTDSYKYILPYFNSKDYKSIEKRWKIYIPFNKQDLVDYLKDDFNN